MIMTLCEWKTLKRFSFTFILQYAVIFRINVPSQEVIINNIIIKIITDTYFHMNVIQILWKINYDQPRREVREWSELI